MYFLSKTISKYRLNIKPIHQAHFEKHGYPSSVAMHGNVNVHDVHIKKCLNYHHHHHQGLQTLLREEPLPWIYPTGVCTWVQTVLW